MSRMRAAVVAGHLCVDLVPELLALPSTGPGDLAEVGALHLSPGGCVANTGGDLAALGATVAAVGDVGDDVRTALRVEPESLAQTADRLVGLGAAVVMVTGGPDGLALRTADAGRLEDAGAMFANEQRRRAWAGCAAFMPAPKVEVRTTLG